MTRAKAAYVDMFVSLLKYFVPSPVELLNTALFDACRARGWVVTVVGVVMTYEACFMMLNTMRQRG